MSSEISAQTKQPTSLITLLPEEVVVDIIARVPRFYYPTLSLVSRYFRSLVASHDLYSRRSLLGCTESFIYVVLYNMDTWSYHLYVLRREAKRNCMVAVPSLPPILAFQGSFVSLGWKIYLVGGLVRHGIDPSAFSIDCRSHTLQPISSVPKRMADTVAGIINGKIYLVGEGYGSMSSELPKKIIMVLDTETQMWEPETTKQDMEIEGFMRRGGGFVMADKIYMRNSNNTFAYSPRESKWETDTMLNSIKWKNACVVDDVLYYYDNHADKLRTYDPKQRCWGVVKGVEKKLLPEAASHCQSHTVNYGGKLAVFLREEKIGGRTMKIWCAEIALERREGGEIWGKVECCDILIDGRFLLVRCLPVTF